MVIRHGTLPVGGAAHSRRRAIGSELAFALVVAASAIPLWITEHLPIQDLPQHLAAVRVLHDYADDSLGFRRFFAIQLGHTQYIGYYFAVHVFAYVFDVVTANRIVLTLAVCALPYGTRSLLDALGRDRWNAVFALPLTYNSHLILGFANFVGALPLMLFGLSAAVRFAREPTRGRGIALGVLALATFYTHVVPFGMLGLGILLLIAGRDFPSRARILVPVLPAGLAALVWIGTTRAGGSVVTAATGSADGGSAPVFVAWGHALRDLPTWMTDILHRRIDERLLVFWLLLLLTAWVVASSRPMRPGGASRNRHLEGLRLRIGLLAPLAALLYFVTPISYDWIWPISGRFPILAALFLVITLPPLDRRAAVPLHVAVVALSLVSFHAVGRAFADAEREEMTGLEETIASIPRGARVAGLIWERDSKHVRFSPYLHSVAWYQVRRGGAVMFTFAELPQSPFRYRSENRPRPVPRHWEWQPSNVHPQRDLAWYDYLLTRGDPPRPRRHGKTWQEIARHGPWAAWAKRSEEREESPARDAEASLPVTPP